MPKTSHKETSAEIMEKANAMPAAQTESLDGGEKPMTISVGTDKENMSKPMTMEEFQDRCQKVNDLTRGLSASMNVGMNAQVMRDEERKETEEEYMKRRQQALYSSITAYEMLDVQRQAIMEEMNDLVHNLKEQFDFEKKYVKQALKDRRDGLQMRFFDREETDKIHDMLEAQSKVEKKRAN